MGLPKRAYTGSYLEIEVLINVYRLKEKGKILFTGNIYAVSLFVGMSTWNVKRYLQTRARCKKKYALRYAKQT